MSRRRLVLFAAIFITGGLAILGFATFVLGILSEFFAQRAALGQRVGISPTIQLAIAGLCVAGLMFALWVMLVALMLARQTRLLGSGYGEAYRLIEEFKFSEAIPLLERLMKQGKESPDVLMLLTSAYAYTGQLAKAQAAADRAVQQYPEDPGAYVTLANGYRLQAAYDEAAVALRAAIDRAPDQPILWAELGFVQQLAGNRADALESFKKAAAHAIPAMYGVRVHYHLAQAYQTAGDITEAVKSTARMMSARDGLDVWKTGLTALTGTAYGSALRYEIASIEQAITDADASKLD